MMKRLHLTLMILFFGLSTIYAQQNYFYYYQNEKVQLTLNKDFLNISTKGEIKREQLAELGLKIEKVITKSTSKANGITKLQFVNSPKEVEYYQKINALRQVKNVTHVAQYFERGHDAKPIGLSNTFYVKLKGEGNTESLNEVVKAKNLSIVKQVPYMPEWYILSINAGSTDNVLDVTNYIMETGNFADIDPAFMFNFERTCTNDTNFGSLWGLDNSSNPAIDINACQAWTITQGLGSKAAILDQGIDISHNDLDTNILGPGYNAPTGTSPSIFGGASHGTHVAGTVGAIKDNNLQVVGVSPKSKILPISHPLTLTPTISAELASGMSWAWQNNADVINNSWGDQGGAYYSQLQSAILENAILNALTLGRNGLGTLVVFAAGNYGTSGAVMDYPGTYHNDITTVGSITSSGARSSFSGYGTKLDVVAPGSNILSTLPGNNIGSMNGTSMASPHVTGTIALILSINPCLTALQVRNILESTSQKVGGYPYAAAAGRPNGNWNNEMGYGLIDAYAAVLMAQSILNPNLDLYVKDSQTPLDTGIQPNTVTPYMWNSQDIWVRVYADNGLVHQNPDYSPTGNPNTVYVRVKNRSCVPSTGNEKLRLYWAKAGTSLSWPASWNGTTILGGQSMGNLIGTVLIPALLPGQEAIVPFSWVVPNPANYAGIIAEPWHFCLLTRIDAPNDPMASTETTDLNENVRRNNNIAWRNVTVVDAIANNSVPVGGVIAVGNPVNAVRPYTLEFISEKGEPGKAIFMDAEVTIKMNGTLLEAWAAGGQQREQMTYLPQEGKLLITGENARLPKITLQPNQIGTLNLAFRFKKDASTKKNFVYHVIQRDSETGRIIGGETYYINKLQQGEQPGTPVAETADAAPSTNYLAALAPNPATDNVLVQYSISNTTQASIMIIGSYGTTTSSNSYDLDVNSTEMNIDISKYPSGFYTVALVCDGKITHTKTLVKK